MIVQVLVDIVSVGSFELLHFEDEAVDHLVDTLLEVIQLLGELQRYSNLLQHSSEVHHAVPLVARMAFAAFLATEQRKGVTPFLGADHEDFGWSLAAGTEVVVLQRNH